MSFEVRVVVVGAIVAAVLWSSPGPVMACSCGPSTEEESYERSSVVFVGTIVDDWRQPPPETGAYSSDLPRWFTFETTAVYKGDVFEEQSIRTVTGGGGCGMEPRGVGPHLIFAVGEADLTRPGAGEFRSSLCSGNRSIADADVPASFGAPRAPLAGPSPTTRPDSTAVATTAPSGTEATVALATAAPAATTLAADPTTAVVDDVASGSIAAEGGTGTTSTTAVLGAVIVGLVLAVAASVAVAVRRRRA